MAKESGVIDGAIPYPQLRDGIATHGVIRSDKLGDVDSWRQVAYAPPQLLVPTPSITQSAKAPRARV